MWNWKFSGKLDQCSFPYENSEVNWKVCPPPVIRNARYTRGSYFHLSSAFEKPCFVWMRGTFFTIFFLLSPGPPINFKMRSY